MQTGQTGFGNQYEGSWLSLSPVVSIWRGDFETTTEDIKIKSTIIKIDLRPFYFEYVLLASK